MKNKGIYMYICNMRNGSIYRYRYIFIFVFPHNHHHNQDLDFGTFLDSCLFTVLSLLVDYLLVFWSLRQRAMLSLYGKTVGEEQNCHCYLQEWFRVISFDSVSFIRRMANLGNICKYSQGEACLSKTGKYQYFCPWKSYWNFSFHCGQKIIIFTGIVQNLE